MAYVAVIRTGGKAGDVASLPLDRERDRIYAYGETFYAARDAFLEQIAGGTAAVKRMLLDRRKILPVDDDEASEIAQMLAAPATHWD